MTRYPALRVSKPDHDLGGLGQLLLHREGGRGIDQRLLFGGQTGENQQPDEKHGNRLEARHLFRFLPLNAILGIDNTHSKRKA